MKATCIARALTDQQSRDLGANPSIKPEYQITHGKEYLIFGVQFTVRSSIYGSTTLFEIEDDAGRCVSIPSLLFRITDGAPSKWWQGRQTETGWFRLWPNEFYTEYFHDDLSNDSPAAVSTFQAVREKLSREHTGDDSEARR